MGTEGGGIPVFDGKGYEIWSKKMKTLFVSQELWGFVQKGYEGEATDMGLGENRKKDCKALYLIQQGVSDSIFPVIMKANTSKEAWEAIRDRFHDDQPQQQIKEIKEREEEKPRATIRLEKMLSKLSPINPERCIFRVPNALRHGNEEFYEPTVLSIGPYHRGKPGLASMEEHKIRYLQQLLQRMDDQSVDLFVQAVKPHEERVRKCYAEPIDSVSSDDLIQMLVMDGCFIIQLFCRMKDRRDQQYWLRERHKYLLSRRRHKILYEDDPEADLMDDDPVINSDVLLDALQNDLLLIENQIPFFIIQILYDVISNHSHTEMLNNLILAFLCRKYLIYDLLPESIFFNLNVHNKYHLLDIAHKTICPIKENEHEVVRNSKDFFCFVDSATKLEEANVTLMPIEKTHFRSNIFDITFCNGRLMIPTFNINYHLEVDIRNFIALELCQQHRKNRHYCDYVIFMDHLIASPDDVKLLIHRGIITNQMIDANFVDNMFKRLTRKIVTSDPYTYYQISQDLNNHCKQSLNKWCASFMQKYFKNPWTIISIVAASMLLALTFTQTLYSIISYYK